MGLLSNVWKTIFFNGQKITPPKSEIVKIIKPISNFKIRSYNQKTKTFKIKKHLIEKGSIDSWTAIQLYGVTRLSAIIFVLRNNGHNIDSINRTAYDRNQEICNFTTYKYINHSGEN